MDFVRIDRSILPPEEHKAATYIEHSLITLQTNAQEFRNTAHLYLFAHERKLLLERTLSPYMWDMIGLIQIAGRNGAVVAASFLEITQAINGSKGEAPTIWAKVDKSERDKGSKLFAKEFPQVSRIRQSAAHPGELIKNPDEAKRHRLKTPLTHRSMQIEGPAHIQDMMHANTDGLAFGATFKGDYVEYCLSLAKADTLDAVATHYRRAFSPLESPQAAQQRAWLQESDERRKRDQSSRPPWWSNLIQL